jgi:DNA-binding MarR family transcriptional regulator/predicted MFS family arabinose efflux permease
MAVIGVPIVLAPVLGPVLGGILVQELSWEWIFFVNVPVGIVAVLAAQRLFPVEAPEPAGRLDVTGLALLATGLPLTIFGLTELGIQGTLVATQVLAPLVAGLVLTALFVVHALRSDHPLLDLRLLGNRAFAAAASTTFVLGAALFGALIIVPLYYQGLRGEGAIVTGLLLAPQGIGAALAMPRSGSLTDRYGGGPVTTVGVVILAAATLPFAFAGPDTSYVLLCLALLVRGIGLGLAMMPAFAAAYAALTPAQVGDATPQLNVLQRIGGSFGTAILTVVLTTQLDGAASPQAGTDAFNLTFLIAAVVTLLAVGPAVVLTRVERRAREGRLAAARVGTEADRAPAGAEDVEALRLAFVELLRAERRLRGRDQKRTDGGLSMAQYRALVRLLDEPELPAGRLAEAADVQPGSMTQMLDGLERDGMVERLRSDADRRVVTVRLTEEGRRAALAKRRHVARLWQAALGDLDPAEVRAGTDVLRRIAAFLDEVRPGS